MAFETLKKERVVKRTGYFDAGCTFYLEKRGGARTEGCFSPRFPFCPLALKSRGCYLPSATPLLTGCRYQWP